MFTFPVGFFEEKPKNTINFCSQDLDVFNRTLHISPVLTTSINFCSQDVDSFTRY